MATVSDGPMAPGPSPAPPPVRADVEVVQYERYIDQQLQKTRLQVKGVEIASSLLALLVGSLVYLFLVALVDHWLIQGGLGFAGRLVFLLLFLAGAGAYFVVAIWPLLARRINPVYAAHAIERSRPSLKNSLINFLLLRSRPGALPPMVYEAVERQAASGLSQVSVENAVDRTRLLHVGWALLAIVALCSVYALVSPKNPLRSFGRVVAPWADIDAPTRVRIADVQPGDAPAFHDQFVTVSAEVSGVAPDEPVTLYYSTADGQLVHQPVAMSLPPGGLRYTADLPPTSGGLQQDLEYYLAAGDAVSRRFGIDVRITPSIIVQRVEYEPPAYTEIGPTAADRQGDLKGIEGTRVTIHASANDDIKAAAIDFDCDGRRDVTMQVDGRRATSSFTLALRPKSDEPEHASYQLRFQNAEGEENPRPVRHQIEVIRDLPPEIAFVEPPEAVLKPARLDATAGDRILNKKKTARGNEPRQKPPSNDAARGVAGQPAAAPAAAGPPEQQLAQGAAMRMAVEALDPDFKLASVKLMAQRNGQALLSNELMPAAVAGPFHGAFVFDTVRLQLNAGDTVVYWAVAEDNKQPEPNRTETPHYSLRITSPDGQRRQDQLAKADPKQQPQQPNDRKDQNQQRQDQRDQRQQGDPQRQNEGQQGEGNPQQQADRRQDQQRRDQQRRDQQAQDDKTAQHQDAEGQAGKGEPGKGQSSQSKPGDPNPSDKQPSGDNKTEEGKSGEGQSGDPQRQAGDQRKEAARSDPPEKQDQPGEAQQQPPVDPEAQPGDAFQKILDHSKQQEDKPSDQKDRADQKEPSEQKTDRSPQDNANAEQQPGGQGEKSPDQKPAGGEKQPDKSAARSDQPASPQAGDKGSREKTDQTQKSASDSPPPQDKSSTRGSDAAGQGGKPGDKPTPGDKAGDKSQQPMPPQTGQSGQKPDAGKPDAGKPDAGKPPASPSGEQQGDKTAADKAAGEKPADAKPSAGQDSASGDQVKKDAPKPGEGGQSGDPQRKDQSKPPEHTGKPEEKKGGDAAAHNQGKAGAGQPGGNEKGTPSPQGDNVPREKQQQPSGAGKPDAKDQPESPAGSKRQSDSKGGESGDQAGGGGQGGGQPSKSQGAGASGMNTASDEGGGRADTKGKGETSDKGGDQTKGKSSDGAGAAGKEPGPGNKTQPGGSKPGAGSDPMQDAQERRPAPQESGDPAASKDGQPKPGGRQPQAEPKSDPQGRKPGESHEQPQGQKPPDNQQPKGQPGKPGDPSQPPSQAGDKDPGSSAGNPTGGGGKPPDNYVKPQGKAAPNEQGEDPANLEYARKATDLALEYLKDQLAKENPDKKLLEDLKWTREDAARFLQRWEKMKRDAQAAGPQGDAARKQLDQALDSLGLRPKGTALRGGEKTETRTPTVRDVRRSEPPPEYRQQFRAFTKGAAQSGQADKPAGNK